MAAEVIALLHNLLTAPVTSTAQTWAEAVQRVLCNALSGLPVLLASTEALASPRTHALQLMSTAKLANAALAALGAFHETVKPGCAVKVSVPSACPSWIPAVMELSFVSGLLPALTPSLLCFCGSSFFLMGVQYCMLQWITDVCFDSVSTGLFECGRWRGCSDSRYCTRCQNMVAGDCVVSMFRWWMYRVRLMISCVCDQVGDRVFTRFWWTYRMCWIKLTDDCVVSMFR